MAEDIGEAAVEDVPVAEGIDEAVAGDVDETVAENIVAAVVVENVRVAEDTIELVTEDIALAAQLGDSTHWASSSEHHDRRPLGPDGNV